jgi:hypothetical protein
VPLVVKKRLTSQLPLMPPRLVQNQEKRNPPDQIIGEERVPKRSRHLTSEVVEDKANGTENFANKAHRHDGPVLDGVDRRPPIAQAINANDHAHALPDHRVNGVGHAREPEKGEGK